MRTGRPYFVPTPGAAEKAALLPGVLAALEKKAEQAADGARAVAPVVSGEYVESIGTDAGIVDGAPVAVVRAGERHGKAFYATFVEIRDAPLRRGVDAAGLELEPYRGDVAE